MSNTPFDDPGEFDKLDFNELEGSLLLVAPMEAIEHVPTVVSQPGERTPAIQAVVTVIDGPFAGRIFRNTLIFPKVLQGQLRGSIGRQVLGRLGKGDADPGKSAPWRLQKATADDQTKAIAAIAKLDDPKPDDGYRSSPGSQSAEPPF